MFNEPVYDKWLSIPETADLLGVPQREVRSAIERRELIAIRRGENRAWAINSALLTQEHGQAAVLPSLRGTLVSLHDAGFSNEESLEWLLRVNQELEVAPLRALHDGKIHAVRRAIQSLAF
ncbi:Rv2175c family DNA-binding protein [Arcanobacterium phocae]|uniref:Rv2175c family DNA-binding protein n=1 Tax=Arcanobacterium phocae TaxID=131112 RepID=UPI001C0F0B30